MLLYLLLLFATNLDPIYGKAILSAASPVSLSQVNCGWLGILILLLTTTSYGLSFECHSSLQQIFRPEHRLLSATSALKCVVRV